jgi:hypothetical protein
MWLRAAGHNMADGGLGHLSYRRCPGRDSSRASSKCNYRAMGHCVLQVGSRRLGPVFRHVCRWHQVSTRALCRGVQRDEVKGELQQTLKNCLQLVRCRSLPSVVVELYVSREGRTLDVRIVCVERGAYTGCMNCMCRERGVHWMYELYVSRERRTLDVRTAEQFCHISFVSFLPKS